MVQKKPTIPVNVTSETSNHNDKVEPATHSCLVILSGESKGKKLVLSGLPVLLGRSPECGINVPDGSISRKHCELREVGSTVLIQDMGSTNGTLVNGERISRIIALRDNDKIKLGKILLKFLSAENVEYEYHDQIYEQSTRDELTGLRNKQFFNEVLLHALEGEGELALAVIVIEHLQSINDLYGEHCGDGVIRMIAERIIATVTSRLEVTRWGGGRFLLIFSPFNKAKSIPQLKNFIKKVNEECFSLETVNIPVTISCGVVFFSSSKVNHLGNARETAEQLIKIATDQQYRAQEEKDLIAIRDLADTKQKEDGLLRVEGLSPIIPVPTAPLVHLPRPVGMNFFSKELRQVLQALKEGEAVLVSACSLRNRAAWQSDIGLHRIQECNKSLFMALSDLAQPNPIGEFGERFFFFKRFTGPIYIAEIRKELLARFKTFLSYLEWSPQPDAIQLSLGFTTSNKQVTAEMLINEAFSSFHQDASTFGSSLLPHPVALSQRLIETADGNIENALEVSRALERTAQLLAHIAVAGLLDPVIYQEAGSELVDKLSKIIKGQNLGTGKYLAILKEVCLVALDRCWPVITVMARSLFPRGEPSNALMAAVRLNEQRNNLAHPRHTVQFENFRALFDEFIEGVHLLKDYQLCTLVNIHVQKGMFIWNLRDHSGAETLFPKLEITRRDHLDTGNTYLIGRESDEILKLSPLIILHEGNGGAQRALFWTSTMKLAPVTSYTSIFDGPGIEQEVRDISELPSLFMARAQRRQRSTDLIKISDILE